MDKNPYVAPQSDFNKGAPEGQQGMFWRSGPLLMTKYGAVLPPRCVKCNGAIHGPAKRRYFYWHHPAVYVVLVVNVLIYAIVAFAIRNRTQLTFGLCREHRRKRTMRILAGAGAVILGLVVVGAGVAASRVEIFLLGFLGFIGGILWMVIAARTLVATRIDTYVAHFKGCGDVFLAGLAQTSVAVAPAPQPGPTP